MQLSDQLQQRRQTVPAFTAQCLEAQSRAALGASVSAGNEAADAVVVAEHGVASTAAATDMRLAVAGSLEQCTTVSAACAHQASGEVQRALEQANEMAAQIGATLAVAGMSSCPTATDMAIVQPVAADGRDKENHDIAAVLRRRRDAQQQQAGLLRQAAAAECSPSL